jgi:fatty acid desaturase
MNSRSSKRVPYPRWYRTHLDRETLARLNAKSDAKGFAQTLGHLGLLAVTFTFALYGAGRWPWWTIAMIVFLHGMIASFAINAVHELTHRSVFRTDGLNALFALKFSFLGWINFPHFYTSHMRHHQFTLHPPEDLEVVLPIRLMVRDFFKRGFVNVAGFLEVLRITIRHARGKFAGEWEIALFPGGEPEKRRPVIFWARFLLAGHGLILLVSLFEGWWLLPVVLSLAPFYGGWLFFLCNNTQHIGLQDNVPDFRLCSRTFLLNPAVRFVYWQMNYHIEHHMYAAVPCYNLGKLHRAIEHELPPPPRGIVATWKEIAAIQKRQNEEPGYQFVAPLPARKSSDSAVA